MLSLVKAPLKTTGIFRPWVLLSVIFISERLLLYFLGLHCWLEALSWYWQVLDPKFLRCDLIQSLLYLHAQPPLFNLLTALLLKTGAGYWIFSLFCLLMGLGMALLLLQFLMELGWNSSSSIALVSLAAILPSWVLYEQWYFYDFPTALLLLFAGFSLLRWTRYGRSPDLFCYLMSLSGLALLRSLFHLLWLIPLLAAPLMLRRPMSRRHRALLLLPLILSGGWYLKNLMVFEFFGSSSWMGLSLAKMTTARLEVGEREAMVGRGIISPYALVRPFAPLAEYEKVSGTSFSDPDIPVLGQRQRALGHPNYNHQGYLQISSTCRRDGFRIIRRRPELYFRAIRRSLSRFFAPMIAYPAFEENLGVIAPVAEKEILIWDSRPAAILIFLFGMTGMAICALKCSSRDSEKMRILAFFILYNILWIFFLGNLLEIGENERFRFIIWPLLLVGIAGLLRKIPRRSESSPPVPQEPRDG